MRLIEYNGSGLSLTGDLVRDIPPYAILSHTWGPDEEITLRDFIDGTGKGKAGYQKIKFCAAQARRDGLQYFWVDTCCLDKSSSELQRAINNMFLWYRNAARCYVYLSDVHDEDLEQSKLARELAFRASRWFTRGWTLQELLAPSSVQFFTKEGRQLGDKWTLGREIHEITGISLAALQGRALGQFSVEERFKWAEARQTTREEDMAYSLFGMFDVTMPLLYGEGRNKAMQRLKKEIATASSQPAPSRPWQDYRPLTATGFRLLEIYPGEEGSNITGYLGEFDIRDPPEYRALSYVWGHEPAIHRIELTSKPFFIRPNLFQALQRMRSPTESVLLWIDSVCINQSDTAERSTQVRKIADIYQHAKDVWIWLGEEDLTSRTAMELVVQINREDFQWGESWWERYDFAAFNDLLERTWFRRRWVMQEAAFSAHSVVFCGSSVVEMDVFTNAVNLVRTKLESISLSSPSGDDEADDFLTSQYSPPNLHAAAALPENFLPNFPDSPAIRLLGIIRDAFDGSGEKSLPSRRLSLETLVELGSFGDTTDPRDAVFALLSLANNADESNPGGSIVPDYSSSLLDVFAEFILHCCHRSGSLDILCRPWAPLSTSGTYAADKTDLLQASRCSWLTSRDGNPFGKSSSTGTAQHRLHGRPLVGSSQKRVYNAHNGTTPQVRLGRSSMTNACDGSLYAKGIVLGDIDVVSTRMAGAIVTNECFEVLTKRPLGTRQLRLGDVHDIVARTLCADRDNRGNPATTKYYFAMQHLIKLNSDRMSSRLNVYMDDGWGGGGGGGAPSYSEENPIPSMDVEELLASPDLPDDVLDLLRAIRDVVWNRRTFRGTGFRSRERENRESAQRHASARPATLVGLLPQQAKRSDQLCILYGCSVPVVLRHRWGGEGRFYQQLVGEAYVHGFMDGAGIASLSPEMLREAEMEFEIR